MKIACISASQVPSSTANSIQVLKACQAMAQLGHSVHLLVPGQARLEWKDLASHYGLNTGAGQAPFSVEWVPAHPRLKRYDFSWWAVGRARALGAEVVYAWPPQAALFGLVRGLPVLLELHGEPEGRLGPAVFRRFLRHPGVKRLLPITQALASHLEKIYGHAFAPGELVLAPNGVDLERYEHLPEPSDARKALGLPEAVTAAYTGHLYPGRGMSLLVELAGEFPQVQFLWVGGRPAEIETWRAKLVEEGVVNVHLTGFVENSRLPLYQAAAEILLMPYERQISGSSGGNSADFCSPMKMFEYMACGRAILSSDLPVIQEVLNPSNAVLCPPENTDAWIEALNRLLEDPLDGQRLAAQARCDVQAYTWLRRAERALEGFGPSGGSRL